jgi:hypothetical protein
MTTLELTRLIRLMLVRADIDPEIVLTHGTAEGNVIKVELKTGEHFEINIKKVSEL